MIDSFVLKNYREALLEATMHRDVDWVDRVFSEFWAEKPTKEEFCYAMSDVLLTPSMLWMVGRE